MLLKFQILPSGTLAQRVQILSNGAFFHPMLLYLHSQFLLLSSYCGNKGLLKIGILYQKLFPHIVFWGHSVPYHIALKLKSITFGWA